MFATKLRSVAYVRAVRQLAEHYADSVVCGVEAKTGIHILLPESSPGNDRRLLTLHRYLKIAEFLTGLQFNLSLQRFRITTQLRPRLGFVRNAELRKCG